MNILEIARDYGLKPKKVASTKGGEYASPCPECGGNDRFRIQPEHKGGRYFCRQCGKSGDNIQFLIDFQGMTFPEACAKVGKILPDRPFQHRYTLPEETAPTMEADEKLPPEERWRRQAAAEVARANEVLLEDEKRLGWLAGRGLDVDAVKRFKLGWIEKPRFQALTKWGLPVERNAKGREKKVWLPKGYLIPQWDAKGQLTMLQVRMDELLPDSDMRYYPVKGSTVTPMVIPPQPSLPPERTPWVTVESRLDALLIAHKVGDLVGVMAQGNNSANPCKETIPLLDASPCILNALDYDDAGDEAFKKWGKRFKKAKRWPVPEGKDPGDYAKDHAGDIRAWVLAGLPPGLRIERSGVMSQESVVSTPQEKTPLYRAIKTQCDRIIHITGDAGTYRKLEDEGKIVFSNLEVKRSKDFQEDGGDVSLLIDVKEIFGGGRINKRVEL